MLCLAKNFLDGLHEGQFMVHDENLGEGDSREEEEGLESVESPKVTGVWFLMNKT